jgi:hypothetical protein
MDYGRFARGLLTSRLSGWPVRRHLHEKTVQRAMQLAVRKAGLSQPTLGDYGTWTLDRARKEARRLLVGVDDKTDPLAERRKQRLEAKTGTVAALIQAYVEARTKDPHRPMKRPDAVLWYAHKFIVPSFGSRPWRDVRRSEVLSNARTPDAFSGVPP